MNNFSELLTSPEDFYKIIPKDIKEEIIEKLYRFIDKQDTYSKNKIKNLDNYLKFLA